MKNIIENYTDTLKITYTLYDFNSEKVGATLDVKSKVKLLIDNLKLIGFENKIIKDDKYLNLNAISNSDVEALNLSDYKTWRREFDKEPEYREEKVIIWKNNINILLTQSDKDNVVYIQIQKDNIFNLDKSILNIIFHHLFYDNKENVAENCFIRSIIYNTYTYDCFERKYGVFKDRAMDKYKNIYEDFLRKNEYRDYVKTYSTFHKKDCMSFIITEYDIGRICNKEGYLETVKNNIVAYVNYNNLLLNRGLLSLYYKDEARIDLSKIIFVLYKDVYEKLDSILK